MSLKVRSISFQTVYPLLEPHPRAATSIRRENKNTNVYGNDADLVGLMFHQEISDTIFFSDVDLFHRDRIIRK